MAQRYATALFELALEANAAASVEADLDRFDKLLTESSDLTRLVRSPVFSAEEQGHAITAVLDQAGIGGLAAQFLKAVIRNRRLFAVRDMIAAFRTLSSRQRGEERASVTVAEPLSEAYLEEVRRTLREFTDKDVKVDVKVDPAIIGGLVVKLGSRMIDTSLRTKLNALRQAMKEVG